MKLSHKLVLSFLLVASLGCVSTYFSLRSYTKISKTFATLTDDETESVEILGRINDATDQIVSSTAEIGFISHIEREPGSTELIDEEKQLNTEGYQAFETGIGEYRELLAKVNPLDIKALNDISASGERLISISKAIVQLNKQQSKGKELTAQRHRFADEETVFSGYVDAKLAQEYREQKEAQANVESEITLATTETSAATGLAFLLAVFSGLYISFLISRRIRKLKDASEKVGDGQLETQIEITSRDEVGDLSRSFNKMTAALKESRSQIESQRERVDTMIANVQGVVWETKTKMEKGETSLRFDFVSDYIETMLGYTAEECVDTPSLWLDIVHPDDRERTEQLVRAIFAGGKGGTLEFRWIARDGHEVWVESRNVIIHDTTGRAVGLRGIAVDITERKSLEQQLTHQALHDPLTKLGNRVLFRDRVEHAIDRTRRTHSPIAVLFLDLDNFKSVNDSLGHAAGDELLVSVTERLQGCLRTSDTPARFGGDEFAVLLEDLEHADQASFIAERIRTVLCAPFSIAGTEVFIGSSIGVAITIDGHETPEELLRNADVAMYMSKGNGKDRFTVFENEMHDVLIRRIRLESDMRSAIDDRQFEVYYQPILDLRSERVMGMEALVRWNHPEHGLIPPLDFIPIAEETGLIVPLGRWILEEACTQAREWQIKHAYGDRLSITVNVASRQFMDESLLPTVKRALTLSKLPPQCLILEITESTMLSNTETTIAKLTELKDLGIRFAIDDFGTGYSSLSYLQRFPVDILKIDKSFIDKIALDKGGAAVAKAIITMSTTLNLKTIAEGIETAGQQTELQNLGCELGQGFHFAKPLRAADMNKFLISSSKAGEETWPDDLVVPAAIEIDQLAEVC